MHIDPAIAAIDAGAIFYSSWGHEQTNVDFYRVEKRAGALVTLVKIESEEESDGELSLTGKVKPAADAAPIGEPFRRKLIAIEHDRVFAKIESYAYAYPWDGKPKRVSHYG